MGEGKRRPCWKCIRACREKRDLRETRAQAKPFDLGAEEKKKQGLRAKNRCGASSRDTARFSPPVANNNLCGQRNDQVQHTSSNPPSSLYTIPEQESPNLRPRCVNPKLLSAVLGSVVLITSVCTSSSASTMLSVFQHNTRSTVIQMSSSHKYFRFFSIVYRVDGHTDKLPPMFFRFSAYMVDGHTDDQTRLPAHRYRKPPEPTTYKDLDIALSRGRALQPRPRRCETPRCELPYGNKHQACETHAYTRLLHAWRQHNSSCSLFPSVLAVRDQHTVRKRRATMIYEML